MWEEDHSMWEDDFAPRGLVPLIPIGVTSQVRHPFDTVKEATSMIESATRRIIQCGRRIIQCQSINQSIN